MDLKLFMTCPRGFEEVCLNEMEALGAIDCIKDKGGVQFEGDLNSIYKINYNSRHGMNLLWEIAILEANSIDTLYESILGINWDDFISIVNSFSLQIRIRECDYIKNSHFAKLKIKDAIVDFFKNKFNDRPNISIKDPDIPIHIFIDKNQIKVYLNSSGDSLFKRNYRTAIHKAALNEVYAAGLVKLSNWQMDRIFIDPMCGSGTIAIESSMIIHNIPSGYLRRKYAFMHWLNYKPNLFKEITELSNDGIIKHKVVDVYGSDVYDRCINLLNASISKFDVGLNIKSSVKGFKYVDFKDSHVITNPPYGVRIGKKDNLEYMYKDLEDKVLDKTKDAFILIEDTDCINYFSSKVEKIAQVMNGNLKCCFIKISS